MDQLDWAAPLSWEPPLVLEGRFARLERLRSDHAVALWPAMEGQPQIWRWLFERPFETATDYAAHIARQAQSDDPAFYALHGPMGWAGVGSLMRIDRANGGIEIGNLCFAPAMQRTPTATEAIFLMADHAFASGFRRLEWKCNALNAPSRAAAARFGFHFEGIFRQHMIVKGANRDTAWFSILDHEWPLIRPAYQAWLDASNFDETGGQRRALSSLMAPVVASLNRPV